MNHVLLPVVIVALLLGLPARGSWAAEDAPAAPSPPPDASSPIGLVPAPGAHEIVPLERAAVSEDVPPEDPYPKLSDLLRLSLPEEQPPDGPQSVEWAGEREEEKQGKGRKKSRARIDFSRENVTADVPMQDDRHQTDVGVSVPVGESEKLRVKGGVRVHERDVSDSERATDTTPRVGVEVQF